MRYILYNTVKQKTLARGYWLDNNRLYKDNIFRQCFSDYTSFQKAMQKLFNSGELAVFYIKSNIAYIKLKNGNINILTKKIQAIVSKKQLKASIKNFLKLYNGVTVFRQKNGYLLNSWIK